MAEAGAGPGRPWSGGGREDLADAVRRLVTLTVTSLAPPEAMAEATAALDAVAERLGGFVPEEGEAPRARFADESVPADRAHTMAEAMPFDVVIGPCNPLAPPVTMHFEPPRAIGRVTFGAAYEGAPGCVHGAAIAGTFDIVLTGANVVAGAAGPTSELTIRYLRPTLVGEESVLEATVVSIEGRRVRSRGTLSQHGLVAVEAEGEFVALDRSRIDRLHRAGRRGPTSTAVETGREGPAP